MILLTTENGLPTDPSNEIYLEPETLAALFDYARKLYEQQRQDNDKASA